MNHRIHIKHAGLGRLLAITLVALLATFVVGCGGDDGDNGDSANGSVEVTAEGHDEEAAEGHDEEVGEGHVEQVAQAFTVADVSATITVGLADFEFIPKDAEGPAGIDEVVTPNNGAVVHELMLYKTDVDPGSLTVSTEDNRADTGPLGEELFEALAEPGETDSVIADLEPGAYAMVCNIPGHYAAGMWGSLTIK